VDGRGFGPSVGHAAWRRPQAQHLFSQTDQSLVDYIGLTRHSVLDQPVQLILDPRQARL
jgi:hypothetical protein